MTRVVLVLALALGVWATAFGLRLAVFAPELCGSGSAHEFRAASAAAAGWMQRALQEDGSYVYIYNADTDSIPNEYNEVRHAGVTAALYQHAGRTGDAEALAAADHALAWMLDEMRPGPGWSAVTRASGTRATLGASALMLVGLAERRLITGDESYDEVMGDLGAFLVALQREDGGFHVAWEYGSGRPDTTGTSPYYPGEALWGLALLHEALPEDRWEQASRDAARFIATLRDDVEGVTTQPLNDHWASYAFAEMAEWELGEPEIAYARRLVARFGGLVEREAKVERNSVSTIGREPRRAASLGTWVEGLAALWRLSATDDRLADLRPEIKRSVSCAGDILAGRQITAEESLDFGMPELAEGAWFGNGETRMDDQQHSLSGLLYAADALDGRSQREPEARLTP